MWVVQIMVRQLNEAKMTLREQFEHKDRGQTQLVSRVGPASWTASTTLDLTTLLGAAGGHRGTLRGFWRIWECL